MFSHSSFILCSDISNCYNVQSFSTATVFIHPSFCYSAQSFLVAIVLSYFPLLQYSIIPHATMLSHSSFATVPTNSHFYNAQGRSEWRAARGSVWEAARDSIKDTRGRVARSHVHGACDRLARLVVRTLGLGNRPLVYHTR
jgi:hypothetical protein